jgi:pimeloyl-ACP methyl ester carboxylesterase
MTDEVIAADHRITTVSTANSVEGEEVSLFIRERYGVTGDLAPTPVLFVHGGTYPGVTDFDLPVADYSWMSFLAARGFHCFAMDCPGYGYSSRHWMDDPEAAAPGHVSPGAFLRSPQSDWKDMDVVVEFIRGRTGADRIHLIGWSAGGPRAGGYAALHPDKVNRLILLAPAYIRDGADISPDASGDVGPPLRLTPRSVFDTMWDNEVKRPDQVDPEVREAVWSQLMEIDPLGASWDPPVVRSPNTSMEGINRGWNRSMAARITAPSLLIAMEWDVHIVPATVEALYEDLTVTEKVYATIGGASHYLPWERDHALLHQLSAAWLSEASIGGLRRAKLTIDPRV